MRIALCNEVIAGAGVGNQRLAFSDQCELAAALGYDGLELAPFTLGDEPHLLPEAKRTELRRVAADSGIAITGLHWLLVTPSGLSVTSTDTDTRGKTIDVIERLIGLCADLGGDVLVHGSPAQRMLPNGEEAAARARAIELFQAIALKAEESSVTYCLEPLSRHETNFINTVDEAVQIVEAVANPAFRTMIDTSAAGLSENHTVDALIRQWLPTGHIAHIQLNDTNRRAPGQGDDDFVSILRALDDSTYIGTAAIEPFIYDPDGPTTAARAIGYINGILHSIRNTRQ